MIEDLRDVIHNYAPGVSDQEIINSINKTCKGEQDRMGVNYWKAVLKKACVNTVDVYNLLKQP